MIPHIFSKYPIPENIPEELKKVIRDFSEQSSSEEFLKKSFEYITQNWWWDRYGIFLYMLRLSETRIWDILKTKWYLHCTTMNYLLRVMLVKSWYYQDNQIQEKWTHIWYIAPHQYLHIVLDNWEYIDIDPWNYQFGIPYGSYGKGFDSTKIFASR